MCTDVCLGVVVIFICRSSFSCFFLLHLLFNPLLAQSFMVNLTAAGLKSIHNGTGEWAVVVPGALLMQYSGVQGRGFSSFHILAVRSLQKPGFLAAYAELCIFRGQIHFKGLTNGCSDTGEGVHLYSWVANPYCLSLPKNDTIRRDVCFRQELCTTVAVVLMNQPDVGVIVFPVFPSLIKQL